MTEAKEEHTMTQDTGQGGGSTTTEALDTTRRKADEAAGRLKEQASSAQHRAKRSAMEAADRRRSQLAERGQGIGTEAEQIAARLHRDGYDAPAKAIEAAAQEFEHAVRYVERTPVQEMLGDARDQAKNRPMAFLGSAFALGFATSRFLKAGTDDEQQEEQLPSEQPVVVAYERRQVVTTGGI